MTQRRSTTFRSRRAREQTRRVEGQRSHVNFVRREVDPSVHCCTEYTIDYGTTEHSCRVCGRLWTLVPVPRDAVAQGAVPWVYSVYPITSKRPPPRRENA